MDFQLKSTNRRGRGLAPIACITLVFALSGCATKKDIRMLREDIVSLQAKQDSLYRESLRQSGALADSVRMTSEMLRTARGQLSNQIKQVQDMLITLQELSGQTQQYVARLREQAERAQAPPPVAQPARSGNPDELYSVAATKLQEKSAAAARAAFEQFLADYSQHERAPDAQYNLAETYVLDEAFADAVRQFERVWESYPTSARAPEAMFRAGEISEQRKRFEDARKYYTLVRTRHGSSPVATRAQARLTAIRGR